MIPSGPSDPASTQTRGEAPSCVDGWVDGWVGGDFLPPSIFLIFKYDNKHDVLIPKICLKVAYAF